MPGLEELGKVIATDVLVIGGGFGGVWAAIRAKDSADNVLLVDKAKVAKSGCSTFAAGVQLCPTPEDDLDLWKKELVVSGGYFPDQEWIDVYFQNQIDRIGDYEKWNAPIERDTAGKMARIVGRGHITTRIFQFHGPKLMELLKKQALAKGVKILERVMVVDLLTSDGHHPTQGRVTGAMGFDTRTAEFHIFKAGAVVLTAGPMGGKRAAAVDNCTGDGVAAAYRAGAELVNLEFCQSGNITAWQRKGSAQGINMIQGHGAYFLNNKGGRFMKNYDPILAERALLYKVCMAFCKESLEGRGPIYVDMRHFNPEVFDRFRRVLPRTMKFWDELGFDPGKEVIECVPHWDVSGSSGQGGIHMGRQCQTNIPGLYAAGAVARSPIHGIYTVGGVSTSSCNVTGYIAGQNAAHYAQENKKVDINPEQVQRLKESILAPLKVERGIEPRDLFTAIAKATVPARFSMFKNQRRILQVLPRLENLKEDLPYIAAPDPHRLVQANEVKNYLLCAELVYRAALEREESRHYHYREDYPYRDDINWLKLIVFKRDGKAITIRHEPIPIDKWPLKPPKRIKTSHPIQIFLGE